MGIFQTLREIFSILEKLWAILLPDVELLLFQNKSSIRIYYTTVKMQRTFDSSKMQL